MTSNVESCKSCFACLVVQHPWNGYLHPANVHVPPLPLYRTYKAETHTLAPASILLYHPFTKQYIQIKDFGDIHLTSLPFISPQTLAPRSWSVSVGPARTTAISLYPCPWLCQWRETSPCCSSLCTLPCPHAIPPQTASALSHVCEMIFLWRTWGKKKTKKNTAANFLTLSLQDNMTKWICLI